MKSLSNTQIRFLRSKSHPLKAVVMIAGKGLNENVQAAIEEAIAHHELIKVKIKANSREQKAELVDQIVQVTGAHKIQMIGHVLTLYRASEESNIVLPK